MTNHVVVVLESTEGRWSLGAANTACSTLGKHYQQRYPEGISVTARLTERRTIFTMTGNVRYVEHELKELANVRNPGVGTAFRIDQGELKVTSATITPPPKRPQSQAATAAPTDDSYSQIFDFMYKMMSLNMQAFES
ncbi:Uncharacterised protein [Mycobacteroides abscessus subsp. bolletii]|uniref:hypothetical protein n=1 Tax=Mycobacteroides abscessus TaxID=36809 RepID=UPI000925DA6C|nr:hypothetical protein [Mycobacteroides abscessus]SHZ35823.1 Uncharacterised protein [Mycobacteroides abscessus subsp. bolletii]SIB00575.1 Uncharacterised protein [Mycobacteroides abscessus subsp. bolletii]